MSLKLDFVLEEQILLVHKNILSGAKTHLRNYHSPFKYVESNIC